MLWFNLPFRPLYKGAIVTESTTEHKKTSREKPSRSERQNS
jgi:hypothetical protein